MTRIELMKSCKTLMSVMKYPLHDMNINALVGFYVSFRSLMFVRMFTESG